MDGVRERLVRDLEAKRQDRVIKWTAVAREFNISPQHLLRIRQGSVPISNDVAAAIDRFLERDRGTTWRLLNAEAAPADREPTDDQLAEMTNREIAELAIRYQRERGPEARREFLGRAKLVRDKALDALVSETAQMNDPR